MALRHVRQGRRCIERQLNVIAGLRARSLPTDEAERVLTWLEEIQRLFENHYRQVLLDGQERLALYERLSAITFPPPRLISACHPLFSPLGQKLASSKGATQWARMTRVEPAES